MKINFEETKKRIRAKRGNYRTFCNLYGLDTDRFKGRIHHKVKMGDDELEAMRADDVLVLEED